MLAIQVNHDLRLALGFLVLLNINLAILNLLPVPVLDGGHILLSIIEWIRKEPVSVKFRNGPPRRLQRCCCVSSCM